jgi:hypothetical protein
MGFCSHICDAVITEPVAKDSSSKLFCNYISKDIPSSARRAAVDDSSESPCAFRSYGAGSVAVLFEENAEKPQVRFKENA